MSSGVLFVDDEPNVLDGIRRGLGRTLDLQTAPGGQEGLQLMADGAEFAVVVSDMKMPGMDGATFLTRVREVQPDSVRMILSGQADLESTIAAVNEGHIFRFLVKPCPVDTLGASVQAALDQYRLVMAERTLLEDTLSGAVSLLTEVLGLVSPHSFSKAARVEQYAVGLAEQLGIQETWQVRIAAMMSQLGCLSVPDDVVKKVAAGLKLDDDEQEIFDDHPSVAARLLKQIPRLETVAEMVAHQGASDTSALGADCATWSPEDQGARILEAAISFDRLVSGGMSHGEAQKSLAAPSAGRAAPILDALSRVRLASHGEVRSVAIGDLRRGMVLEEEVRLKDGVLLVARGYEVTDSLLARLRGFARQGAVQGPFAARVPD